MLNELSRRIFNAKQNVSLNKMAAEHFKMNQPLSKTVNCFVSGFVKN